MKYDENNQPVLNKPELEAAMKRDYLHDNGMSDQSAARDAIADMKQPSKKFVEWLSRGTLTLTHGEVTDVEAEKEEPAHA